MDVRRAAQALGIGAMVVGMLAGSAGATAAAPAAALAQRIDQAVAGFSGRASVLFLDVRSGFEYGTDADRVIPAASLYKLAVMVDAYRRVVAGTLSLDDPITITDDDLEDDGYFTPSGTTLTVREAIERMITISDNSPAQALVRTLDAHQVNATASALGLAHTRINAVLPPEEQLAPFNTTTARDIGLLFSGLAHGRVVSASASAAMLDVLGRQQINDRLPAGLPDGTPIAHKTGDLDGISHDAGLITTPNGRRIVVMLTSDVAREDDVVTLAEDLASTAYGVPLDTFAARFKRAPASITVAGGSAATFDVTVQNASAFAWGPTTYLAVRSPRVGGRDVAHVSFAPLAAGDALTLSVAIVAPAGPGVYLVELEIMDRDLGTSGNTLPVVLVVR